MKKTKSLYLILVLCVAFSFGITPSGLSQESVVSKTKAQPVVPSAPQIAVRDNSDDQYLLNLAKLMNQAKSSIFISLEGFDHEFPLLREILAAREKGIVVKVWVSGMTQYEVQAHKDFWERLKNSGVQLFWVSAISRVSDQLVVIDQKHVIEGGSLLKGDLASGTWIDSTFLAKQKLARFNKLPLREEKSRASVSSSFVKLPKILLTNKELLPEIVKNEDDNAWRLYFHLLKIQQERGQDLLEISPQELVSLLNLEAKKSRTLLLRKKTEMPSVAKILDRLQKKYSLISYSGLNTEPSFRISFAFSLKQDSFLNQKKNVLLIPYQFYESQYMDEWSSETQFAYLLSLNQEAESENKPYWNTSLYKLSERYHIKEGLLREGFYKLKREDALEFVFTSLNDSGRNTFSSLSSLAYKNNGLRTFDQKQRDLEVLKTQLSGNDEALWSKARMYAELFDDPFDVEMLRKFTQLIKKYSVATLEPVVFRLSQLPPDNSLRTLDYLEKVLSKAK